MEILRGKQLQMRIKFYQTGSNPSPSIIVLSSDTSQERTSIGYNYEQQYVYVDRSKSSLNEQADSSTQTVQVAPDAGGIVLFDIIIDHSIIEVCMNYVCLTR